MMLSNNENWPKLNERRWRRRTDTKGRFEMDSTLPHESPYSIFDLTVTAIHKKGYEFIAEDNPQLKFDYRTDSPDCHKPNKQAPIVLRVRAK